MFLKNTSMKAFEDIAKRSRFLQDHSTINAILRTSSRHPLMTAGAGAFIASTGRSRSNGAAAAHRSQDNYYIKRMRAQQQSSMLSGVVGNSIGGMTG